MANSILNSSMALIPYVCPLTSSEFIALEGLKGKVNEAFSKGLKINDVWESHPTSLSHFYNLADHIERQGNQPLAEEIRMQTMEFVRVSPLSPIINDPHFLTPPLTGPYPVGVKSYRLHNCDKQLLIDLHYPGIPSEKPTYKFLPLSAKDHPMNTNGIQDPVKKAQLENLWTRSQPDLEVAKEKFPVVIFSHGKGGNHFDSQHFIEELASHGYCVITVNHPTSNPFSDIEKIGPPAPPPGIKMLEPIIKEQSKDLLFLINQLKKGVFRDQMGETMDVNQIGVIGHSLGGDTALKACTKTDLIRTGIDLDSSNFKHVDKKGIKQPILSIVAKNGAFFKDPVIQDEYNEFAKRSTLTELKEISNATHNDFDVSPLFDAIKTDTPNPGYAQIYTETSQKIVDWFKKHLKNS